MHTLVVWALFVAAGAAPPPSAQSPEHLPEWRLNLARSTFDPGPPPRSGVTTLFTAGRFIKVVTKTVDADGSLHTIEYRVAADGNEVPVKGSPVYDRISVERINADTSRATRKKNGKVVQISTRVLSEGGSTMTFTTTGTDERGRPVHDVTVFERQ